MKKNSNEDKTAAAYFDHGATIQEALKSNKAQVLVNNALLPVILCSIIHTEIKFQNEHDEQGLADLGSLAFLFKEKEQDRELCSSQ